MLSLLYRLSSGYRPSYSRTHEDKPKVHITYTHVRRHYSFENGKFGVQKKK